MGKNLGRLVIFFLMVAPIGAFAQSDPAADPTAAPSDDPSTNQAAAPETTPETTAEDADFDQHIPGYVTEQPSSSFGFRAALNRFPTISSIGSSYQIFGEYLLPWQKAGIFSAGLHGGILRLQTLDDAVPEGLPPLSSFSAGAQVRYQLKLWKLQWVIPTIGLEWDYFSVRTSSDASVAPTSSNTFGVTYGVLISLTNIDSHTARDAFDSLGMTHAYLTVEVQPFTLTTPTTFVSGNFWYFGVRLEFN